MRLVEHYKYGAQKHDLGVKLSTWDQEEENQEGPRESLPSLPSSKRKRGRQEGPNHTPIELQPLIEEEEEGARGRFDPGCLGREEGAEESEDFDDVRWKRCRGDVSVEADVP